MATLSEVVRRRRELENRSRTSAFVGGVGEKLKEKFDPRQMLNQTGILATLFPSLKAFQARGRYDASDPRRASRATYRTRRPSRTLRTHLALQISPLELPTKPSRWTSEP